MPNEKPPNPTPDVRKMFQLAEHYSTASQLLSEQAKGDQWGCSAPQILVDSFAVELYLKCLYVLDNSVAPPVGHDLKMLFNALPSYTKDDIRLAFYRIVSAEPVLANLHLINPEAVKVTQFERSLEAAKRTFDKRRYLYEENPDGEWFYADLLRQAVRTVTKMDIRVASLTNLDPIEDG